MSTDFSGFSDIPEVTPTAKDKKKKSLFDRERKLAKRLKSSNKLLKRLIKLNVRREREREAAREAEAAQAAQEAAQKAEMKENKKGEKAFWEKLGDAIIKAVPVLISAVAGAFVKLLFQRKAQVVAT
jgi:hypothetical protein